MGARRIYVPAASVAAGILVGWAVGAAHRTCEHSCPALGPCPTPPGCLHQQFNWTGALVVGLIAAALVGLLGLLALRSETVRG